MVCIISSLFVLPSHLDDCVTAMTTQILWFLKKLINSQLATTAVVGFWLATTTVVQAGYEPPPDQKSPSGYTQSTGSRGGCEATKKTSFTTLAPHKHVGQTASQHPTFAWFVPESKPFPMEFALYQYGSGNQIKLAYKTQLKTSPGIMKLSLPKNHPGLAWGERYIWQIAILCDFNHPSSDLVANAEIEAVKMPSILKKQLSGIRDAKEKIERYAKAGLWYDALASALGAKDLSLKKVASNLLEDLAKLEQPETAQVTPFPASYYLLRQ